MLEALQELHKLVVWVNPNRPGLDRDAGILERHDYGSDALDSETGAVAKVWVGASPLEGETGLEAAAIINVEDPGPLEGLRSHFPRQGFVYDDAADVV